MKLCPLCVTSLAALLWACEPVVTGERSAVDTIPSEDIELPVMPGIQIRGGTLIVSIHDVLIQHLVFRPGDGKEGVHPDNRDAFKIDNWRGEKVENSVVANTSMQWSIDDVLSTYHLGINNALGRNLSGAPA